MILRILGFRIGAVANKFFVGRGVKVNTKNDDKNLKKCHWTLKIKWDTCMSNFSDRVKLSSTDYWNNIGDDFPLPALFRVLFRVDLCRNVLNCVPSTLVRNEPNIRKSKHFCQLFIFCIFTSWIPDSCSLDWQYFSWGGGRIPHFWLQWIACYEST